MRALVTAALAVAVACAPAITSGADLETGRNLFESSALGTSGKSCATCHPGGRKLEWASTFEEDKLTRVVNNCIGSMLKGKALDPASEEMKSLVLYIRSLGG